MRSFIFSALLFASLSVSAHNEQLSVEVFEVPDTEEPIALNYPGCKQNRIDLSSIGWGDIVNIGEKLWKLIVDNQPVAHFQTPVAHAMPRGLSCWTDLSGWKAPITRSFVARYTNGLGGEVVNFRFRVHYTHGGGNGSIGQYLANVTVLPANLDVSWGYTFNAKVEAGHPVNLGTAKNPMAGLELNVDWTVSTPLQFHRSNFHVFVQGDGVLQTAN